MDKAERARQKRAAKKKESRQEAAADRARRIMREAPASLPAARASAPEDAAGWPVHECWATEEWYEQGARVHVTFARRHESGRVAAAFFDVDLAEAGVVQASWRDDLTEQGYRYEVSERAQERVMREVEPALAVKIVQEGLAWGERRGHDQAEGAARAMALFGDVRASKARDAVLTGRPDVVEREPRKGLMGWLFGG
jgi:hypothetical protein